MSRQCLSCDEWFVPRCGGRPQLCCTPACSYGRHKTAVLERQRALNAIKKLVPRTCRHCSRSFVQPSGTYQFCSDECRLYSQSYTPKQKTSFKCVVCNSPYLSLAKNTRTCSLACRMTRQRQINNQKISTVVRLCRKCSSPIFAPRVLFCCVICRKGWNSEKDKPRKRTVEQKRRKQIVEKARRSLAQAALAALQEMGVI